MIACSVFDDQWLMIVGERQDRTFLFIAEGVFPYFTNQQVFQIFSRLAEIFPGSELICDAMTPTMVRLLNLNLMLLRMEARLHWGFENGHQPENWNQGTRLLNEWFYFDEAEPRLGASRVMRFIPFLAKGVGIFHYQFGLSSTRMP